MQNHFGRYSNCNQCYFVSDSNNGAVNKNTLALNAAENNSENIYKNDRINPSKSLQIFPSGNKLLNFMLVSQPYSSYTYSYKINVNNKLFKKKNKAFAEREGDWYCEKCKNLNFAFRTHCNRCNTSKIKELNKSEND